MANKRVNKKHWIGIPPWIVLGAVIILVPIFVFLTLENIHKQKENTTLLLLEKGAALIRSFEAGARTGMMGLEEFLIIRIELFIFSNHYSLAQT